MVMTPQAENMRTGYRLRARDNRPESAIPYSNRPKSFALTLRSLATTLNATSPGADFRTSRHPWQRFAVADLQTPRLASPRACNWRRWKTIGKHACRASLLTAARLGTQVPPLLTRSEPPCNPLSIFCNHPIPTYLPP